MANPARPPATRRRTSVPPPDALPEVEDGGPALASPGPAIDHVLGELERVVAELEAGDLPLEVALQRFEAGVRLARQGGQLLDAVEQRVELLLDGREGTVPFPGAREDDEEDEDDDGDI
jgi:exodeoxyribonuclease VII small subunit